jgi:hypothetical protein
MTPASAVLAILSKDFVRAMLPAPAARYLLDTKADTKADKMMDRCWEDGHEHQKKVFQEKWDL